MLGRSGRAKAIATSPIGRFSRKMKCQSATCVSTPPSTTPTAPPADATKPQTLMALARSAGSGKRSRITESATAWTIAPPMPWTPRAPMSSHCEVARPQASDAAVNSARPAMRTVRRPMRSAARPPRSRKPPNVRTYAFTTHARPACEKPRSRWIAGSAMFTIVASSTIISAPKQTSPSAAQRRMSRSATRSLSRTRMAARAELTAASAKGRDVLREVLEDLAPALALLVLAHLHLDGERELRLALHVRKGRRYDAAVAEDLDDRFGHGDFPVRALEGEALLAVVGGTHTDAELSARADLGLRVRRLPVVREHPLHDVLWLRVRLEHELSRRLEDPSERERPSADVGRGGGAAAAQQGGELVEALAESLVGGSLHRLEVLDRLEPVGDGEPGPGALRLEHDRHEHERRDALRALAFEREHEPLVRHHFAEDALAGEEAAVRTTHVDPYGAPRSHVELADGGGEVLRREPLRHLLRIGPRPEHELARRVEHAARDELALARGLRPPGITGCGHVSFPFRGWSVAPARSASPEAGGGSRRGGRSAAPKSAGSARPNRRPPANARARGGGA